jgi:hypothetical protein
MAKVSRLPQTSSPSGSDLDGPGPASSAEAAAYIFQMAGELAAIADAFELENLAYLLEIAKLEAGNPSRKALKKTG